MPNRVDHVFPDAEFDHRLVRCGIEPGGAAGGRYAFFQPTIAEREGLVPRKANVLTHILLRVVTGEVETSATKRPVVRRPHKLIIIRANVQLALLLLRYILA